MHGRSLYEAFLALEEMSVRAWGAVPTVHGQRGGRAAWRGNAGPATPCMCIHTYRPHTLKGRGKGQLHSTRTLLLWKGGQGTLQWAPPMGNTHFLFPCLIYGGPSSSSAPAHACLPDLTWLPCGRGRVSHLSAAPTVAMDTCSPSLSNSFFYLLPEITPHDFYSSMLVIIY